MATIGGGRVRKNTRAQTIDASRRGAKRAAHSDNRTESTLAEISALIDPGPVTDFVKRCEERIRAMRVRE
jgi:hypothetical protein